MILIQYINGNQHRVYENVKPTSLFLQQQAKNKNYHLLSFSVIEDEMVINKDFQVDKATSFQLMPDWMLGKTDK